MAALIHGPFLSPVVTSAKQHLSPKYGNAKALADDVAEKKFEIELLIGLTEKRIGRSLSANEQSEIESGITNLVSRLQVAAGQEPQTEFARKMLMAINEIVVPAVVRREGLGFDFNSLRRLWLMGAEFQISCATSAHPRHDGWLTFNTATIELTKTGDKSKRYDLITGFNVSPTGFLDRLFEAYNLLQEWGHPAVVTAWQLRATFCFQNWTAPGVFIICSGRITAAARTHTGSRRTSRLATNPNTKSHCASAAGNRLDPDLEEVTMLNYFEVRAGGRLHPL